MSKYTSTIAALVAIVVAGDAARAQAAPPATDIFLAPIRIQGGKPVVGTPVNITNRPGYDNQPSFTSDSKAVLFTSIRADAQADIYRYDLATKTTTRITSTPESEYSATVYGDGARFTTIRVEADSTQRLWSFRLDGTDPRLVFDGIKPVGYHAWVDSTTVAMFLLGRPNALVIADIREGRPDTVARDVGRSLLPLPSWHGFSFLQRMGDSSWILMAVDVRGATRAHRSIVMPLVLMPAGADYVAWLDNAVALTGAKNGIWLWRASEHTGRWSEIADLTTYGLRNISRLALSPDHAWLAIVAEPASAQGRNAATSFR